MEEQTREPIVELRDVQKTYPGVTETKALANVNLAFERSSFSSIVGESGSGKTTLMNIIGTLDRPTQGEVWIGGVSTAGLDKNRLAELRNRQIGFIFQFHYLLPEFTVLENILMPPRIQNGRLNGSVRERAEELVKVVGLSEVQDKPSTKISGGQQQRTAIARALINEPALVLADEPTGNLDSENTANIYSLLRDINREEGTTFVVVTHDERIAAKTDRVVELRDGQVEADRTR